MNHIKLTIILGNSARQEVSTNRVRWNPKQVKDRSVLRQATKTFTIEDLPMHGVLDELPNTQEVAGLHDEWDRQDLRRALRGLLENRKYTLRLIPEHNSFSFYLEYGTGPWRVPNGVVRLMGMLGVLVFQASDPAQPQVNRRQAERLLEMVRE